MATKTYNETTLTYGDTIITYNDTGTTYLYLPINASSNTDVPTSFEWYIPTQPSGSGKTNFQIQIDKTDDTFADLELEKWSYKDSGFEYYDGASWVAIPTSGVDYSYVGNLARYQVHLSDGLKHWRVRAFAG